MSNGDNRHGDLHDEHRDGRGYDDHHDSDGPHRDGHPLT